MAQIHHESQGAVSSEVELFNVPLTNSSIVSGEWVEYSPISNINENSTITFTVAGNSETYIDMSKTLLHLQVRLVNPVDGKTIPADTVYGQDGKTVVTAADVVAPVNLFHSSLFSEVHVSLGDRSVTPSPQNYPYKAMFQTTVTFGGPAKTSFLTAAMYYKDTAGKFNTPSENDGFKKRASFARQGTIDLMGTVHTDLCQQSRFIPNLIDLKFKFIKSPNEFCIHATGGIKWKVQYELASLYIRKVKLIPEIVISHAKCLEISTMKYPITRTECNSFSINSGTKICVRDNLFMGQLPKRVLFALVEQNAYLGDYSQSPFNFQHFDLNHIALFLDGTSIPHKPLTPNFKEHQYMRSYTNLFTETSQWLLDEGNFISREEYPGGNAIFAFELSPDLSCSDSQFQLIKNGNLRLELKFAKDLPKTVSVLYYAEFQNLIEIDKNRNVIYDYTN